MRIDPLQDKPLLSMVGHTRMYGDEKRVVHIARAIRLGRDHAACLGKLCGHGVYLIHFIVPLW